MRKLAGEIERLVHQVCANEYQNARWDEDNISYRLVEGLQNLLNGRQIDYDHFRKNVSLKAYKQQGAQETAHGDIAILVNIQFSDGETLKGVAFLEAKRLFNSGYFESIDLNQLARIRDNVPYAQVLQYYPSPAPFLLKFPFDSGFRSSMWVAPINTSHELLKQIPAKDNHKVIRVSFPLSQFITGRILWGKDLDFRPELYDDVLKAVDKKINPKYLCVLHTYYLNQRPLETIVGDTWKRIE